MPTGQADSTAARHSGLDNECRRTGLAFVIIVHVVERHVSMQIRLLLPQLNKSCLSPLRPLRQSRSSIHAQNSRAGRMSAREADAVIRVKNVCGVGLQAETQSRHCVHAVHNPTQPRAAEGDYSHALQSPLHLTVYPTAAPSPRDLRAEKHRKWPVVELMCRQWRLQRRRRENNCQVETARHDVLYRRASQNCILLSPPRLQLALSTRGCPATSLLLGKACIQSERRDL